MKTSLLLFSWFACGLAVLAAADAAEVTTPTPGWSYVETGRIPAAEARQGVAADREYVYAIANYSIGKYNKRSGERVAAWQCPEGKPLTHLNAGVIWQERLYCAHSNYPGVPMLSSVEVWDTKDLSHVASHSFGRADGSLTWIDRREGRWIACFVHYGKKGGEPGKGPEWTRLVEYDDSWIELRGWAFPSDLIAHIGGRGYSVSGGAFGPDGNLYVTGHDNTELYVLRFPDAGPTLIWEATVTVVAQGQAFGWDPQEEGVIHMLARGSREIISGKIQRPEPPRTGSR